MKSRELLKKWLSIVSDKKAIIKAEPIIEKNTKVSDMGDANAKFIADLIRETITEVESLSQISPYNAAHTLYGNCCGIFNSINDDGILCCNECGMTMVELIDFLQSGNNTTTAKLQKYKNDNSGLLATDKTTDEIIEDILNSLGESAEIDLAFRDVIKIKEIIKGALEKLLYKI